MDSASQSPVLPESAPTTAGRFHPYHSPNHRVTKGRYITSTDPRGYVPVYEYPLNNQWIMMDVDDGYVLWTGIWKALGNSKGKSDIVKMVEAQPELASQLRRVRGGYLKIQGTWLPYEVALRLARRVAWPIRHDLVPLFGPTFPDTCLAPDQPGYGQVVPSAGRKGKRSKYQTNPLPGPAQTSLSDSDAKTHVHPYSPSSAGSTEAPGLEQSPSAYPSSQYYQAMPTTAPGPSSHHHHPSSYSQRYSAGAGGEYYSGTDESSGGGGGRNASSASSNGSRHRYAPYPSTTSPSSFPPPSSSTSATPRQAQYPTPLPPHSPSPSYSSPPPQHRDTRYDLPSLSAMDLPRPPQVRPNGFSLPPIRSLREPEMDASTVLRRLRLDDNVEGGQQQPHPHHRSASGSSYQAVSVPYPAGQPTYYGDERYYGVSDPRFAPPPGQQTYQHAPVTASSRGGAPAPRQW